MRQYDPVSPNPSVVERDAAGRVVRDCVRPNECDVVTYGDGVNPTHVLTRTGGAHMQQFDAAGRLVTANALAARMMGLAPDRLRGNC